jgi:hypothetical protein
VQRRNAAGDTIALNSCTEMFPFKSSSCGEFADDDVVLKPDIWLKIV